MGNTPSTVPYSSQLNLISVALDCYAGSKNVHNEIAFSISLTAPLVGGAGQQVYYSDIYPEIILPLAQNASQYTANVSIDLDITNAATTITFQGPASIRRGIQAAGLQAGPITLGTPGVSRYSLAEVNITLTTTEGANFDLHCPKPPVTAIIGSTVVDTSTGPPLAPANNARGVFPTTAFGSRAVVANLQLDCSVDSTLNIETFNLTLNGVAPVILSQGQNFSISQLTTFVTIPADVVAALGDGYGGTSVVEIGLGENASGAPTGTGLGAGITNAEPAFRDLARDWTPSDPNIRKPLQGNQRVDHANDYQPLTFALPLDGVLTVDPYTAGQSGTVFGLNITSLAGFVGAYNVETKVLLDEVAFQCNVAFGVDLFATQIV